MKPTTIYLDHAATTPVRPEARDAMLPFLDGAFGNPSGVHATSRAAKDAVEAAREEAAVILAAAHPLDIVFTGGGTEADNLAVTGRVLADGGGAVASAVEHQAVLEPMAFLERLGHRVHRVDVEPDGRVDPGKVAAAVDASTSVVSVMTANNETGVVQPVAEVSEAVRRVSTRPLIHTDAAQSFVSAAVSVGSLGVDLLSLSAHKFGGPQGVGLLHVRRDVSLEPVLHGGGQERGRRSGTHNVAGIVGMVTAMREAVADRARFRREVSAARDAFEEALRAALPDVEFTTDPSGRLVQHSHFRVPGVDAETLLIRLDGMGVAAAAGSACHSGAVEVSHVLAAMGIDGDRARSSVRFTFGWTSRVEDGREAARRVTECVEAIR